MAVAMHVSTAYGRGYSWPNESLGVAPLVDIHGTVQ